VDFYFFLGGCLADEPLGPVGFGACRFAVTRFLLDPGCPPRGRMEPLCVDCDVPLIDGFLLVIALHSP
jgi:hypothetical protein